MAKAIESKFSLTLGKFYVFCELVLYTQCSKLPFSVKYLHMFSCCVVLHKSCSCTILIPVRVLLHT